MDARGYRPTAEQLSNLDILRMIAELECDKSDRVDKTDIRAITLDKTVPWPSLPQHLLRVLMAEWRRRLNRASIDQYRLTGEEPVHIVEIKPYNY